MTKNCEKYLPTHLLGRIFELRQLRPKLLLIYFLLFLVRYVPLAYANPEIVGSDYPNVDVTGNFNSTVSLEFPTYYGLEPKLILGYQSSARNGWLGVGWDIAGLSSIKRLSPGMGVPRYDSSDLFYLDGVELIPCRAGMNSPSCKYSASLNYVGYTTRIEGFQRIAFNPQRTSSGTWYKWDKDGPRWDTNYPILSGLQRIVC
jgi:hypothetical protein